MRASNPPDRRRAAAAARRLAAELGIAHPTDLAIEIVAHARGALVRSVPLSGAQASLVRVGDRARIGLAEGLSRRRRRYSIAHELGHLLLHPEIGFFGQCEVDASPTSTAPTSYESEANAFATEWLLPRRLARPLCATAPATWHVVEEIAEEFDVSLTAAAMRFVAFTDKPVALISVRGGNARLMRRSWRFRPRLLASVPSHEASRVTTATRGFAARPSRVPAELWLEAPEASATVSEHVFAMPAAYGTVMVLLELEGGTATRKDGEEKST